MHCYILAVFCEEILQKYSQMGVFFIPSFLAEVFNYLSLVKTADSLFYFYFLLLLLFFLSNFIYQKKETNII